MPFTYFETPWRASKIFICISYSPYSNNFQPLLLNIDYMKQITMPSLNMGSSTVFKKQVFNRVMSIMVQPMNYQCIQFTNPQPVSIQLYLWRNILNDSLGQYCSQESCKWKCWVLCNPLPLVNLSYHVTSCFLVINRKKILCKISVSKFI